MFRTEVAGIFQTIEKNIPHFVPTVLLCIVLLIFLSVAFVESVIDLGYSDQDESYFCYVRNAQIYIQMQGLLGPFNHYFSNYPPAFFSLSALVLPEDLEGGRPAVRFLIWFWLIIALVGTYLFLSQRITRVGALWAITLFVASPCFRYALKYLTLDIGLLAMFPWMLFAFDRSDSFRSFAWTICTGLLVTVGVLMRFDFLILAVVPLLFQISGIRKDENLKAVRNLLFFFFLTGILVAFFLIKTDPPSGLIRFSFLSLANIGKATLHLQMLSTILSPHRFLYGHCLES